MEMKILLVGNYSHLRSQSMDKFATLLYNGLKSKGHNVRLIKPMPEIGRFRPSPTRIGKWLGYLDRFILFRFVLIKAVRWADVVHICDQANAVYLPWLKVKPNVVTCHDMLAISSALGEIVEHQTRLIGRIYQYWILSSLKKAMHVSCVSNKTREDVLRLTKIPKENISVIPNGFNYPYRPMASNESIGHLKKMGFSESNPFLLHVGGNFWYKNKAGLLRIFARIVRLDDNNTWRLVLAGAALPENQFRLATKLEISDRIRQAVNVSNEQLCALYSAAQGLIYPSLAEGFGWPIIEAQTCGCPVFTSNRRPMTDVGGDGAVYFDPEDEDGAARKICDSLKNKFQLIQRGFQNAANYSTKAMISGYINIYRQALK